MPKTSYAAPAVSLSSLSAPPSLRSNSAPQATKKARKATATPAPNIPRSIRSSATTAHPAAGLIQPRACM